MLQVKNLCFGYTSARNILQDISFTVSRGECVGLTGPSGCGKSTLLFCASGIIPTFYGGNLRGEILLDARPLAAYSRTELAQTVGVVFQNPANRLFTPSVAEEISFGLQNLCLPAEEIEQRVTDTLELLQISALRERNPALLSGGQQQLVALAIVFAMQPKVYFLDEVVSQVDEEGRALVLERLEILRQQGATMLMIDHNGENLALTDRVLTLRGEGTL